MTAINYVIEGKYADDWEEVDVVTEEEYGEKGAPAEAARLLGEYRIAAPYAPHRMRAVPTDS